MILRFFLAIVTAGASPLLAQTVRRVPVPPVGARAALPALAAIPSAALPISDAPPAPAPTVDVASPFHQDVLRALAKRSPRLPFASVLALPSVTDHAATLDPQVLDPFWDGRGGKDRSPAAAAPFERPSWLALKNEAKAAALANAIRLMKETDVGRRALQGADRALAGGRALPVEIADLKGNDGEFDYVSGVLRLNRRLFAPRSAADLAVTLAHELLHVAQRAAGLPPNALELEIEAHLLDLDMLAELGVPFRRGSFAWQTREALRRGPERFAALIRSAVPDGPFLGEGRLTAVKAAFEFEMVEEELEQNLEAAQARRGPRARKLAGMIAEALDVLREPAGRRLYRDFSQRVMDLLAARASAARR